MTDMKKLVGWFFRQTPHVAVAAERQKDVLCRREAKVTDGMGVKSQLWKLLEEIGEKKRFGYETREPQG